MSEVVTVSSGVTGTIYGTFADATAYLGAAFGDTYTKWFALPAADQKRTLIGATRYLDRQAWIADYATFTARDAVLAFQLASYELAALTGSDADVLTAADTSANIQNLNAGGAGITFFNPTSTRTGTATKLPTVVMQLVGPYLSAASLGGADGGTGASGSCDNPFSGRRDFDRDWPY